jgi:hypothetical protein
MIDRPASSLGVTRLEPHPLRVPLAPSLGLSTHVRFVGHLHYGT